MRSKDIAFARQVPPISDQANINANLKTAAANDNFGVPATFANDNLPLVAAA